MGKKINLFTESDQEDAETVELRTNKGYAKHYDEFRKKEILGQLKNLDAEEESSDSSDDETTDDEIVDADFDKEFFRTLAFLKRNDPRKYAEQPTFFENVKPVEEVALTKRHHKEKPMTLKDYERKVILEKGGVYEDEEDIEPGSSRMQQRPESPSLVEQQKKIKDEIKQALKKINDSDSDGDEEDENARGGGLLTERSKSKDQNEKEQADYIQWLADKKAKEAPSEDVKALEPLKHFWSSAKLSKEDTFLKDYILNKRFVQNGDIPSYEEIVATSEDEEELDKQEEYERQYNFRFEEPDPEFIKRYPRTVEDSVRIERNKRKEQRQAIKERKQKEKEQQRRDLDELKAVKLQEIKDKIQRLKEIAATDNLAMNEADLESDFDPEEHDRRMHTMFNDDYYGVDEGDQKPEFPELDTELGIENYDKEHIDDDADAEPYCEDDDFVMDCDYEAKPKTAKEAHQEELLESTRSRKKKGRRQSKFRELLKAEKPLFDPEDEKTYGEYIDEYYKLDYEDMIGDTPCRFRYVETVPNDFGLSVEEILAANTRELNRWASVKKTVQLRPKQTELQEIDLYRRKGGNEILKRKLLPSLFIETDINEDVDEEIKERQQDDEATKPKPEDEKKIENDGKNSGKQRSEKGSKPRDDSKKMDTNQEHSKKKVKDKPTFADTEQTNGQQKEEKKKKKLKKDQQSDENPGPNGRGAETKPDQSPLAEQSKRSTKDQWSNRKPTNGTNDGPASDHNRGQKRQWNTSNGNGAKKPRFGQNERPHSQNGSAKQKGAKKPESASDQRLRAFGLNPRKFHNTQKYGNQQHKNDSFGQTKPLNTRITFE